MDKTKGLKKLDSINLNNQTILQLLDKKGFILKNGQEIAETNANGEIENVDSISWFNGNKEYTIYGCDATIDIATYDLDAHEVNVETYDLYMNGDEIFIDMKNDEIVINEHDAMLRSDSYQKELEKVAQSVMSQLGTNANVLITGGSGMLGTELADAIMYANKYYDANINVTVQARSEAGLEKFNCYKDSELFHSVALDVSKGLATNDASYDAVFHYAANADPASYKNDPEGTRKGILDGARAVAQYATKHPETKVFCAGTMEEYGKLPYEDGKHITEDMPLGVGLSRDNWRDLAYSYAKIDALDIYKEAVDNGAHITVGRIPYTFGPTHKEGNSLATHQFFDNGRRGIDVEVKNPLASGTFRGYDSAADVTVYALYQLNAPAGDVANLIGTNNTMTFLDFAKTVAEANDVGFTAAPQGAIDKEATRQLSNNCLYGGKITDRIANSEHPVSRVYDTLEDAIIAESAVLHETDMIIDGLVRAQDFYKESGFIEFEYDENDHSIDNQPPSLIYQAEEMLMTNDDIEPEDITAQYDDFEL